MYVYIQSEPDLWTVGRYDEKGKWHPKSDHDHILGAAEKANELNRKPCPTLAQIESILDDGLEAYSSYDEGYISPASLKSTAKEILSLLTTQVL